MVDRQRAPGTAVVATFHPDARQLARLRIDLPPEVLEAFRAGLASGQLPAVLGDATATTEE